MMDWGHWVQGNDYVSFHESLTIASNCALSARDKCREIGGYPLELLRLIRTGIGRIGNTRIFSIGKCCGGADKKKEKLVIDPIKEEIKLALRQSKEKLADGPDPTLGDLYDIGRKLGEGGFASVYSANRRYDHELVALKRILKSEVMDWVQESDGNRYPMEVSITSKVKAIDGVPALLDVFVTATTYVLVLEQPPTPVKNLEDYIQERSKDLSEEELCDILRKVIKIVADVHEAGVSHRDIKTENILIEVKNGRVHLIDFGGGITVEGAKEKRFSGSWFNRKSKQIFSCAQQNAERCNVYSIGLLAYRLMTKDRPLMQRINGKVSILFPEHFSSDLRNFLSLCLATELKDSPTIRQLSTLPWLTPQVSIKRTRRFLNLLLPVNLLVPCLAQKTICEMAASLKVWIKSKYLSQPRATFFIGEPDEIEQVSSIEKLSEKSEKKCEKKSKPKSEKSSSNVLRSIGRMESIAVYILDEKNQYERYRH